jgi:hypothetical protein
MSSTSPSSAPTRTGETILGGRCSVDVTAKTVTVAGMTDEAAVGNAISEAGHRIA